jgi:parallel beta-helix repeat protein
MHTSHFTSYGARVSQCPLTLALALALGLSSAPLVCRAATITVFTTDDAGGATDCTLRQAVVSMNAGDVSGTGCVNTGDVFGIGDTINFDTTVFPFFGANTITLADASTSTLAISDANLTIAAGPYARVTIKRPAGATNDFGIIYDGAPAGSSLTLSNLTLSNGKVTATNCNGKIGGGGICMTAADLTLNKSTLSGNYSGYSGGAILSRSGNVTLTNCTLSNNVAYQLGGGIFVTDSNFILTNSTLSGNSANGVQYSYGGGIFSSGADITMTNSTLSGNSAGYGGGIWNGSGNLSLTNSTLSGNAATQAAVRFFGNAGAIWTSSSGHVQLYNSTISGNSAAGDNGGIYAYSATPTIHAINSIVAGNTSPGGDTNATLNAGSTNNIIGTDPALAALADNGGPTQTMLPLATSPAIDAANDAQCPATDQRGVKRPQGAHCDIGAVELLTAQIANSNLLFTNWSSGINFNGPLYTAGGDCSGSCFAIGDNFGNGESWRITDIAVYIVSANGYTGGNWRYALFTEAGVQVVPPTSVAPTFVDLGPFTGPYSGSYEVYQIVIPGLNISLAPGQYQLRFTNTQFQSIYAAYGVNTSAQTLSPGFFQLTGSPTVEALLSTDVTQRSQEWAFDLYGAMLPIFKDGFEGP